jgi:hypothetical protein
VRDRAAHETKVDALRAFEPDRLHRRRDPPLLRREVRRQNHVRAALPDLQLLPEGARRPAQVRSGDQVEDELAVGGDLPAAWPQRPNPPPHADIDRERAAGEQPVRAQATEGERRHQDQASHTAECTNQLLRRIGLAAPS